MKTRPLALRTWLTVASLLSLALFAVQPASSQAAAPSSTPGSDSWTLGRTEFGHPDLSGTWSNNTATPLQRPKLLGDKATLTDEELTELREKLQELWDSEQAGDLLGDFLIQKVLDDPEFRGFDQDTGNYNSFWLVERELDHRTSLIIDPPNGRMPAMKPDAMARLGASFGGGGPPADMEPLPNGTRCISYGVPNTLAGYNSYFTVYQTENYVTILQELIHHARIIPLDDRPPMPDDMRFWNGHSRGHWEENTLVVETGNYNRQGAYRAASENLRVVERFERVGPELIEWTITYQDDQTWERTWTMMIPLSRTEDRIYEYACHEGNHSLEGIMKGARLEELDSQSGD